MSPVATYTLVILATLIVVVLIAYVTNTVHRMQRAAAREEAQRREFIDRVVEEIIRQLAAGVEASAEASKPPAEPSSTKPSSTKPFEEARPSTASISTTEASPVKLKSREHRPTPPAYAPEEAWLKAPVWYRSRASSMRSAFGERPFTLEEAHATPTFRHLSLEGTKRLLDLMVKLLLLEHADGRYRVRPPADGA